MSLSYSWNYKLSTCTLSLRDAHCMHSTYTLSFMNTEYSSHDYDLYSSQDYDLYRLGQGILP